MNPNFNLPPGCRERDIPGNGPDTFAYCKGCEREFNTDEFDDDGKCERCVAEEQAACNAAHAEWIAKSGKTWCQPAGQWLDPEDICQCGNQRDIKDHPRCSECEAGRAEFERDCREGR